MLDEQQRFDAIAERMTARSATARGQMFGKPSLSVNGNAFAAFHAGSMAFKLQEPDRSEALALDGARLWDPSGKGKPMKEWVAIPASKGSEWEKLTDAAYDYVGGLPPKQR